MSTNDYGGPDFQVAEDLRAWAEGHFDQVMPSGGGYVALCPAHDDRKPSLSIHQGDGGRILLHCHAGCDTGAVLAAARLDWGDLFPGVPGGAPGAGPAKRKALSEGRATPATACTSTCWAGWDCRTGTANTCSRAA